MSLALAVMGPREEGDGRYDGCGGLCALPRPEEEDKEAEEEMGDEVAEEMEDSEPAKS